MKYKVLFITAFAVLSAVSCQTEPSISELPVREQGTVTISAGFVDTRTSIDGSTGIVSWSAHEQILLFPSSYGLQVKDGKVFTSTNTGTQETAEFVGTLPSADFDFTNYWAIYPNHAAAFCNGDYQLACGKNGVISTTGYSQHGNGGLYTKNSDNLVVAMLTDYYGQSFTIDTDGGTASFEFSVTAPAEVHSSQTGNWGDLDEMQILLYTQRAYGSQAKVRATAPLNDSSRYIDNSRIVIPGDSCGFEVE